MKILSNTEGGGRVVELSKDEIMELYLLAKSCNPDVEDVQEATWKLMNESPERHFVEIDGFDFSLVLENVRAFRESQFNVNKIRSLVNEIEKSIKKNEN